MTLKGVISLKVYTWVFENTAWTRMRPNNFAKIHKRCEARRTTCRCQATVHSTTAYSTEVACDSSYRKTRLNQVMSEKEGVEAHVGANKLPSMQQWLAHLAMSCTWAGANSIHAATVGSLAMSGI